MTGAAFPDACHIIPFAWNKNQANTSVTASLVDAYSSCIATEIEPSRVNSFQKRLCTVQGTDKAWNMLCLSPQVHRLWSRCYFGFKWLGKTPAPDGIVQATLQFNWLPRTTRSPSSLINEQHIQASIHQIRDFNKEPVNSAGDPIVNILDLSTGFPIVSGHTITVCIPDADTDKFEEVIRLQWALVQLAAMSGAAENVDLMGPRDPFVEAFLMSQGTRASLTDHLVNGFTVRDQGRASKTGDEQNEPPSEEREMGRGASEGADDSSLDDSPPKKGKDNSPGN